MGLSISWKINICRDFGHNTTLYILLRNQMLRRCSALQELFSFFLQELLNIVLEFKGRSFGGVSLIRLTVVIYQEFGKIPPDIFSSVIRRDSFLQKSKDFASFGTVHMSLLKERELITASKFINKIQNFFVSSWLLGCKLIAWEGKNLEPPGT